MSTAISQGKLSVTDAERFEEFVEQMKEALDMETTELWGADPECEHIIICAPGGGIKCTKCNGWYCY